MAQVHECEQCGKVISKDDDWMEVSYTADDVLGVFTGRIHAQCLEAWRKTHPRK